MNDIATAVEALRRVILREPGDRLAWVARDGAEAVEKCKRDTPDLILMELMMPVMDGAEATLRIMKNTPCPILIVTSAIETNSAKVFQALGAGALDAVQAPLLGGSAKAAGFAALKFKIEKIGRLGSQDDGYKRPGKDARNEPALSSKADECLIAIGASAGGPGEHPPGRPSDSVSLHGRTSVR